MRMIFYDDAAIVKGEKYNKKDCIEFLMQLRKETKRKYVTAKVRNHNVIYKFKVNREVIEVVFPDMYEETNKVYESILYSWLKQDKRRIFGRLKFLAIVLTAGICVYKFHPQISDAMEDVKEYFEDGIDDIKFYTQNLDEVSAIKHLEDELRSHSGYGDIEGYKQTVVDHNNSFCYLGGNIKEQDMNDAISDFCNLEELGNDVAVEACKKYRLYLNEDLKSANEIKLLGIYRENLDKVKTHK